uniref:Ribosomal protein S1 n=1 Tax=Polysiphonia sertularioides TaxID=945028 RepID=A0A1Z1M906_9FLOR|nr:ribosomal protein S1 [Polysiphonia sertularioides]ARW62578.1 ribosomal protein S1 [Polysiphonia sertularioides]
MKKKKDHFAEILNKYKYTIHEGDIVAGTIIQHEKKGFLVAIGTNVSGYLPKEEVKIHSQNKNQYSLLLLTMTRDFFLVTQNTYNKQYILSIKRLDYIRAWKRIKQLYLEDIVYYLTIKRLNKGGIITYLEGIQGFIPKSHISNKNKKLRRHEMIKCKLINSHENKNHLILSNKSARLTALKNKFKLGQIIYGEVVMKKNYGIFININNIRTLLHISETNSEVNSKKILHLGEFIKLKIIYINTQEGLVSLSTRTIKTDINHHLQHS